MVIHAVLLVEGQDDKHVLSNLLFAHGLQLDFEIRDKDGVDSLLSALPMELRRSDLKRLGIVVDADSPIGDRWKQVRSVLIKVGYVEVPLAPQPEGTVLTAKGKPAIGVWMMPDNRQDGMLEDFAAFLVPANDTLMARARAAVDQIPPAERLFTHEMKATIHTWLAWQREPGVRMGAAITRKYLEGDSPAAAPFLDWLKRLRAT